jgi:hypothetical protein
MAAQRWSVLTEKCSHASVKTNMPVFDGFMMDYFEGNQTFVYRDGGKQPQK